MDEQEFYELARPVIRVEVLRAGIPDSDWEDVAQESWIRAWQAWRRRHDDPTIEGDPIKFWKGVARQSTRFTVAVYYSLDAKPSQHRPAGSRREQAMDPYGFSDAAKSVFAAIDEFEFSASYGHVHAAIARLSKGQQDAIRRVFWGMESIKSLAGNQRAYYRAIERLRQLLEEEQHGGEGEGRGS